MRRERSDRGRRARSSFERVSVEGRRYFLKQLSPATGLDRCGHWRSRAPPLPDWQAGLMDRVPTCIDHTVVVMRSTAAATQPCAPP